MKENNPKGHPMAPCTTPKTAEHFRAVLAVAVRDGKHDIAAQARHDMKVAMFERRIKALVDAAPALTDEQRVRLTAIFSPTTDADQ